MGDVDRFDVGMVVFFLFNVRDMVVVWFGKVDVVVDGGNFYVDDFFFNNIEDWEEVERECVLGVVEVWVVVE